MSTLRLIALSCVDTQEAEDEITVKYTDDWAPGGRAEATVLHPRTMDRGDSVTLSYEPEFEHAAVVSLWEVDRTGTDDFIGFVLITPLYEDTGEHTLTVERPGLGSYRLTFEVLSGRVTAERPVLRLLSLICDDAQEREDEPVLMVNGREVWSGHMRSDDSRTLDIAVSFNREARIDLWERDSVRSDAFSSLLVDRTLRGDGVQEARFAIDRGIVGDATYRLRYQVE